VPLPKDGKGESCPPAVSHPAAPEQRIKRTAQGIVATHFMEFWLHLGFRINPLILPPSAEKGKS
jgi:hypothetical protein